MANRLKLAKVHGIIGLLERRWSYRRTARVLGVHSETVARYDRLRRSAVSKLANPPLGLEAGEYSKPANVTPGSAMILTILFCDQGTGLRWCLDTGAVSGPRSSAPECSQATSVSSGRLVV